jgi:hypothetical protein
MLQPFSGQRRIDAAKDVLTDVVTNDLPPGIPVALRWFRQGQKSCASELAVPLGPLDPTTMATTIDSVDVRKVTGTPLAAAIEAVRHDLGRVSGPRIVILVSDGKESCGGDPSAAVEGLIAEGYDVTVNVIGIGLDRRTRKQVARLAALGHGSYFQADDPGSLGDAIAKAVSAPFQVFDAEARLVGQGTVDGEPVQLPAGTYQVVVLMEPVLTFDSVVLEAGGSLELTVP